jgi:hypothetical protein
MLTQKQLEDQQKQDRRIDDVFVAILELLLKKSGDIPDLTKFEIDCALLKVLTLNAKGRCLLDINIYSLDIKV